MKLTLKHAHHYLAEQNMRSSNVVLSPTKSPNNKKNVMFVYDTYHLRGCGR